MGSSALFAPSKELSSSIKPFVIPRLRSRRGRRCLPHTPAPLPARDKRTVPVNAHEKTPAFSIVVSISVVGCGLLKFGNEGRGKGLLFNGLNLSI